MTICRKCGTSNKDDRKYCTFCNELLVADPVELALRDKKLQKVADKKEKKLQRKRKKQKRALFLLIPIGILDLINLLCCLDMLFLGIADEIGRFLGNLVEGWLGNIIYLLSFPVYTADCVQIVVRSLEFLTGAGCFIVASVLGLVMFVRMIKWHKYKKALALQESAAAQADAEQTAQSEDAVVPATETVVPEGEIMREGVSFEALEQVQAQKEDYVMPEPLSQITCKQLYEQLSAALWQFEGADVRRLLAAMSCSRLLLCDAGVMDGAEVLPALYAAFGVPAQPCNAPEEVGSLANLLLLKESEEQPTTHSAFAKAVYTAQFSPKNMTLAGVCGIKPQQLSVAFAAIGHYFRLPDEGARIYLGQPEHNVSLQGIEQGVLSVGENLWIPCVLSEGYAPGKVQGEVAQYSVPVVLHKSKSAVAPMEAVAPVTPSVAAWTSAVNVAEQEYYLSEELWKSLDELDAAMQEACGVKLSNRTLRSVEKYTAVYLATGGKPVEALDSAIVSLILPAYAQEMRTLRQRSEGENLAHLLERTVGRDRLPLTMHALGEMMPD